jgi:hypothetical protein
MFAIRILKARRLRWAGHVARMREKSYAYSDLVRKRREDLDVGGGIILK